MQSFKKCQQECCGHLLMILLANRPQGVHLHASTLSNVAEVRALAAEVFQTYFGAPGVSAGAPWPVDMQARDRPDPAGRGWEIRYDTAPDAEERVREALQELVPNVYCHPSDVPCRLAAVFASVLAKGTLKTILEGLPDLVEVDSQSNPWRFKVLPQPADAAAMPGGPGVPAGPPDIAVGAPAFAAPPQEAAMPGGPGVSAGPSDIAACSGTPALAALRAPPTDARAVQQMLFIGDKRFVWDETSQDWHKWGGCYGRR